MTKQTAGGGHWWWLAPVVFLLDRLTKVWAQSALGAGRIIDVIPGVFRLNYVENTGAAFGMLQGRQGLLSVVTGLVLAALLVCLIVYRRRLPSLPKAALWVLFGGALGNLADRVLYGYVIDFMEAVFVRFPVFNVADICVCVGCGLLMGWIVFGWEAKRDAG